MGWWDEVRLALQAFLDQHGVLAGFLMILIEEAGVPVPVPGDFLMLVLGVHAHEGRVPLWQALLVMEVATLLGACFLYLLAARAGRGLVYRYGRYMHLTPERLDRAERWLLRRGSMAIVLGRVTPGLRIATVIACGVFKVPLWRFLPSLALGAFLYILMYTLLGYFLGPTVLGVVTAVHLPLGVLGSLVPLVLLLVWIARARRALDLGPTTAAGAADRRHRWRDGAVAGGLATVVSTLTMNVLVHAAGGLALLEPGDLIERTRARVAVLVFVQVIGPVLLLAAAPAFMAVGVFWGAVYAEWVEPHLHWPDWLSGVFFALLPLSVALVVVLPLLGSASTAVEPLGPLAAVSEAVRHLAYGAALGVTYPLRLARIPARWRRTRANLPASVAHSTS